MKDKMDGVEEVAHKARLLAERVLPGRPHHLTLNPNRKYAPPPGFWFTGQSSRLQYLTNLSDADRGMLLTIPFFEIMDEPETSKTVKTIPGGEARKKMSMKDYKARKKSLSPMDNDTSIKAGARQGTTGDTTAPKEKERSQETRPKEINGHDSVNGEKGRLEQNGDRATLPSRPENKNTAAQETRKRPPDPETTSQPQKKPKTGDASSRPSQAGDSRSSTQRSREAPKDKPPLKEARDTREVKAGTPLGAANGRLQVSSEKDKSSSSPRSTIMVNGARSRAGSSTSTPRKGDKGDVSRPHIPRLLSPPSQIDLKDDAPSPRKRPAGKAPLKGVVPPGHSRGNSMTKPPIPDLLSPIHLGLDDDQDSLGKRSQDKIQAKLPPTAKAVKRPKALIPPLLSPTLPPVVEEDLLRNPPPPAIPISELPAAMVSGANKTVKSLTGPKYRTADANVRSRIVVLRYKKPLRARVQAILSLPSRSRREALRKERSASEERAPPARKRPLSSAEAASEVAPKRSRPAADILQPRPAAPTTPLKNSSTSMIRVLSNTSQANTPGDSTHLTPGAVVERPPTSSEHLEPAILARCNALRERFAKHNKLGSTLKHKKDALVGKNAAPAASIPDAGNKRAAALHFEMVLSYMVAFRALNASRQLERKPLNLDMWESLLPHFQELRMRTHRSRPLTALAAQMHALCLEEYCHAFTWMDEKAAGAVFHRWVRYAKKRREVWEEAKALADKVEEGKMRVSLGPWTNTDDAVAAALVVMRRWAAAEEVDWRAELNVPA